MPTLHVHADESGDLKPTQHGSAHVTFTAAWTYDPKPLATRLRDLRFSLLRSGQNLERFHARNDRAWCRRAVFAELAAHDDWSFASVVVRKDRLFEPLQEPLAFYPRFLPMVLRFVLRGRIERGTDRVLIYTDRIPLNNKRKAIEKALHVCCRSELHPTIAFHMYHHSAASNDWLQVADYCCWAVHRKHEAGDTTYYEMIAHRLAARELYLWR